jgi:hypothetical protein
MIMGFVNQTVHGQQVTVAEIDGYVLVEQQAWSSAVSGPQAWSLRVDAADPYSSGGGQREFIYRMTGEWGGTYELNDQGHVVKLMRADGTTLWELPNPLGEIDPETDPHRWLNGIQVNGAPYFTEVTLASTGTQISGW